MYNDQLELHTGWYHSHIKRVRRHRPLRVRGFILDPKCKNLSQVAYHVPRPRTSTPSTQKLCDWLSYYYFCGMLAQIPSFVIGLVQTWVAYYLFSFPVEVSIHPCNIFFSCLDAANCSAWSIIYLGIWCKVVTKWEDIGLCRFLFLYQIVIESVKSALFLRHHLL